MKDDQQLNIGNIGLSSLDTKGTIPQAEHYSAIQPKIPVEVISRKQEPVIPG